MFLVLGGGRRVNFSSNLALLCSYLVEGRKVSLNDVMSDLGLVTNIDAHRLVSRILNDESAQCAEEAMLRRAGREATAQAARKVGVIVETYLPSEVESYIRSNTTFNAQAARCTRAWGILSLKLISDRKLR